MDIPGGKQRPFPAVTIAAVLLLLCIIPGQFWVAKLFPALSGLVRIDPSLVFMDLPIDLPVSIDLILVPGLFLLVYPIVVLVYPSRPGIPSWQQAVSRVRSAFAGLLILLICMLSGGLIYYLVQEYLSRRVRNGIDSMGIMADIHLSYPGYENIHLRGSTVLLVCFITGMLICIRKIRKEPGRQKAGRLTREQRMTPYERMIQEKRVKEKQLVQEARIKKKGTPASIPPATIPAERNNRRGLCRHQPVMTFKPEAVNYMPAK